ncbi:acyltransferase family protein [Saccharicrinis sp. FJH62]|uniref:acyltransferase family protein n=1 Tax=Saccharicrinis sp. FJH62 TaxID=3344657 RepID=UPI0035D4CD3E
MTERRYDIDWLRVIAIGLLLIYHIAIVFQPWGVLIGFMQSPESLTSVWTPMTMLNIWRIPLLFFVSGMGVAFAIRKRNFKALLKERTLRIFIPFTAGMLLITPLHVMIWQNYYNQDITYTISQSHLWFLLNIFLYVIILSPLFFYLKKHKEGLFMQALQRILNNPFGLSVITVPFVLEALIVNPELFELYAQTLHGYILGFMAFFFGFILVETGNAFWNTVKKWRWQLLLLAMLLYLVRWYFFNLRSPDFLMSIESNLWIFSALGFAFKYLNRPGKTLRYLSQAVYPVYILHMIFLFLASSLILPLSVSIWLKFIIIVVLTMGGCLLTYEFVIKRINVLRPLFGMKISSKSQPRSLQRNTLPA